MAIVRPFEVEKARKLLQAERPWKLADFVDAGLYFRDYGEVLTSVVQTAIAVRDLFGPEQAHLTLEQRDALEDLDLTLQMLEVHA